MSNWKDTSSFSQGDTERVPNRFEAKFGNILLVVHRHIHFSKDTWLVSCKPELFRPRELKSKDILEAQCQAVAMLQVELGFALNAIVRSNDQNRLIM